LVAPVSSLLTTDWSNAWSNAPIDPDTPTLVVGAGARVECEIGVHLKCVGTSVVPSFEVGAGGEPPETPAFVGTGARVEIGIGCHIKGVGTLVGPAFGTCGRLETFDTPTLVGTEPRVGEEVGARTTGDGTLMGGGCGFFKGRALLGGGTCAALCVHTYFCALLRNRHCPSQHLSAGSFGSHGYLVSS
jgi:hypothetical protein